LASPKKQIVMTPRYRPGASDRTAYFLMIELAAVDDLAKPSK
jgi:hypothetical protein